MSFNGYAVNLNGVMFTTCHTQTEWDELDCAPATVFDVLTEVPAGLDLPSLRTEDVTYPQRDGVKHFSDWYLPRFVTVVGTFGPISTDDCVDGDCSTIREQLAEAVQAWKRTCCDTEMVVFTDCTRPIDTPPDNDAWEQVAENLALNPSAETEQQWFNLLSDRLTDSWSTTQVYAGTKSRKSLKASTIGDADDVYLMKLENAGGLDSDSINVTVGETYTASVWLYAPAGYEGGVCLQWDDATFDCSADIALTANTWTRVDVTGVCPLTGFVFVNPYIQAAAGNATIGHIGYADAVLVEQSATVGDYFDGDTETVYDPVTYTWARFLWTDTANQSSSLKESQTGPFQGSTVNGPFGIVGRPTEFKYKQQFRNDQIYDFVALFRGVDQRMYVLDECGTPGYENCVDIQPGSQLLSICLEDGVCFTGAGFCFTNSVESGGSVDPTELAVGGTERVYPTITLYPGLASPTIENITTGEYIQYDGDIDTLPVTINTEEGTAFDSEGNSMTHLLRGSLFLSLEPGNYEWRLLASGEDVEDPGYATACWRDTIVSA